MFASKAAKIPSKRGSNSKSTIVRPGEALAIGKRHDPLEHEADRVAERAMRPPASGADRQARRVGSARAADRQAGTAPRSVYEALRSCSQPIDEQARSTFEPRFGFDFSGVRIHDNALANESAAAVGANAYTVGSHLVFAAGMYQPRAPRGMQLLAHELSHVVQQSSGGQPLVQRDQSDTDMARGPKSREAWPGGPKSKRKSKTHGFGEYLGWVEQVERAYGKDQQAILQRLRRLYYSSDSGPSGSTYDLVIVDQIGAEGQPLHVPQISQEALDGLYETNVVELYNHQLVDVSHVLVGLDLRAAGLGVKARIGEDAQQVKFMGVLTWTGDLASWFLNWIEKQRAKPTPDSQLTPGEDDIGLPAPVFDEKSFSSADFAAQKTNLLSDMDAHVLADQHIRDWTPARLEAEGGAMIHPRDLDMPVSKLLTKYYGIGLTTAESRNRFAEFVRVASPPIPHVFANLDGSGPISLGPKASDAIHQAIYNTARLLLERGGRRYPFGPEVLDQETSALHEMARRFTQFLATGLKSGDAPWP